MDAICSELIELQTAGVLEEPEEAKARPAAVLEHAFFHRHCTHH